MNDKLVFALLIRVSSQQQDEIGHSLETQREVLTADVESLGGEVYRIYGGVESAYKKGDRPILEELLTDSKLKLFNAVIVTELSRLSRNTEKAIILYEHFKKNDLKLFIGTQEFNPNSAEHKLMFSILSAINEHQSSMISEKAIAVKKSRAALGFPSTGEVPYGRKCVNIKTKDTIPVWELIPEKKNIADLIFNYYVNENMSYYAISKLIGLHHRTIRGILNEFAGEDWSLEIENKTYPIKVPALFTEEQINKIQNAKLLHISSPGKAPDNKSHVLAGFVKCMNCGKKMYSGQNSRGNRYYKHYVTPFFKPTDLCTKNVPAYYLENLVFAQIGEIIASGEKLKEAIENVTSRFVDNENDLESEISILKSRLEEEIKSKDRIILSISKGIIDDEESSKIISQIRSNIISIQSQLTIKNKRLDFIKSDYPSRFNSSVKEFFEIISQKEGRILADWDPKLQREILKIFFGNAKNNIGIFVQKTGSKRFKYNINGIIINGQGNFESNILESTMVSELGSMVNNATIDTPIDIDSITKVCELVTAWTQSVIQHHFSIVGEFMAKGVAAGMLKKL
jgi:DNA invertase Pin-like site-specific DNA recombinase